MKKFNVAKALKNDEKVYKPLERAVLYVLAEIIYKPIFEIVREEIGGDWLGLELPKVMQERKKQKADDLKDEIERNKEQVILSKLLNEGVAVGVFNSQQAKTLPSILSVIYSAIDQQLLHQTDINEININNICNDVISFVMVGITNDLKQ